jgi:hypothetical protein
MAVMEGMEGCDLRMASVEEVPCARRHPLIFSHRSSPLVVTAVTAGSGAVCGEALPLPMGQSVAGTKIVSSQAVACGGT